MRVPGDGREPDAVTPHVRICEGPRVNEAWLKSCDTTTGKPVANSEHKPYPNEGTALNPIRATARKRSRWSLKKMRAKW